MTKKVAIIGAGYCGLAAASELNANGYDVSVFEAMDIPGGLAVGRKRDNYDWPIEALYHHWFNNEKSILDLADKFNLTDILKTYSPTTSFFHNNSIKSFDKPQHLLNYPGLSFLDKWELGVSLVKLKLSVSWESFEQVTAQEWISEYMGENVYNTLWKPMMIGKWGKYYNKINMAWFWARIHVRTQKLMYPDGGFQTFSDQITNKLKENGVKFYFNQQICKIQKTYDGNHYRLMNNVHEKFDIVLSTVNPKNFLNSVDEYPESYRKEISSLRSMGAICMMFVLKKKVINNSYWINIPASTTNPVESKIPFLVFVEHTNMISSEHYNNQHIVYCGNYLEPEHNLFNYSKEEIFRLYFSGMQVLNPKISEDDIIDTQLTKTNYASPVFLVNHSKIVPSFDTPFPNLFWASMNHVYPWDRGTNYAVKMGFKVAKHIIEKNSN